MPVRMTNLTIKGFKTIRELADFKPRPINILIGANGAGKSNFISFFRLLSWMTSESLQDYIAREGGAHAILHDGAEVTREFEAETRLETEKGSNDYGFRLFFAAGDTLVFAEERYRFSRRDVATEAPWRQLGAGHRETGLTGEAEPNDLTARTLLALLRKCKVYQFHNTSSTARMRGKWNLDDSRWLKEDAGNIAPFLYRLRRDEPRCYRRIVDTIGMIIPFFAGFEFEPEHNHVMLKWRERKSDVVFDASQAADGMLRAMALVTLLGQPESGLPSVLILDEPELGLHPYAIHVVAGMLRASSEHCQVFVATQSTTFIDNFDPEDVVVVNRAGRESTFTRLDGKELDEWLEEYSIAELWEKNVIGGRPSR